MAECNKCQISIRGETGIKCIGVCGKIYHGSSKCSGIDQYSQKILETNNFIRFICDDCVQYIHNVDMVLKNIQDEVVKNTNKMVEYKHEFGSSLKQNEYEIKELLKAIEIRYEERVSKMDRVHKSFEKNLNEIKNLAGYIKDFENKNKEIYKNIEEKNQSMYNEIKTVIKETNEDQKKMSYAEQIKSKVVMPDLSIRVPLIVKPKEKQTIEKTKEALNKNVNPVNLKIKSVENRRNGAVVIQSENEEEREKIRSAIQNELNDAYEIKVPRPINMQIKIVGMSFDYEEKDLVEKLKKQNPVISNSDIKIIVKYNYKRNNKIIYNAKISVDSATYAKILGEGKLNIGWERCKAFDGTEIMQCLKCKGYNHRAKECRNEEICLKCHENHKTKECDKEQIVKCINCVSINRKLNMGLDENHVTNDKQCKVYQNKLNAKMKRIGLIE